MASIDTNTFLVLLLVAVSAAGLGGFLAGLFGIGGGAIYVPILYQAFESFGVDHSVTMHLAVGTSLAIIVPTSLRSLQVHWRRGAVDRALLGEWTIAVPLGAVAGAVLAASISSEALRGIFAALACLFALKMMFGRFEFTLGSEMPGLAARSAVGGTIGLLSSLMGIGGGVLNNTFMTLYGRSIHRAVATSAGVGTLIAIPGLISYIVGGWGEADLPAFSAGYVSLIMAAAIIPVSVLFVPLGAALAHRLSRRQLELGFGIFLFIVAVRFVVSLF